MVTMVTFAQGDLGRFAEDTTLVVNLGKSLPFLCLTFMVKEEVNPTFLEICSTFLWPIGSSLPLYSGKMAVGITHSLSQRNQPKDLELQDLDVLLQIQVAAIWFFICPTRYLWDAPHGLGKMQDEETMLSLLSRDLSVSRIITESQTLLFFDHRLVVCSRPPCR